MFRVRHTSAVLVVAVIAAACGGGADDPDAPPVDSVARLDAVSTADAARSDAPILPDGTPLPDGVSVPDGAPPPPDAVRPPDAFVPPPPPDAFVPPPPPDAFVPPPPPDAFVPPPPPDAAPLPVIVTAFQTSGVPASGATIVFNNPDGSVLTTATASAAGQASAVVPAGGSVTAVLTLGRFRWLSTVMDVQPGDTIELGNPNGVGTPTSVGTLSLRTPATGVSGRTLEGSVGCSTAVISSTRIPVDLDVTTACPTEPDALGVGIDTDGNGDVTHYFFEKRVGLVGGAASVVGASWRTDFTSSTVSVLAAPAGTASVEASSTGFSQGFGRLVATRSATITSGGAGTFVLPMMNAYPEAVEHLVTTFATVGRSSIRFRAATAPGTRTIALATELLPFPSVPTITGHTVAWSTSGGTATPDGGLLAALWTEPTEARGYWTVVFPPGITTFVLPTMPAAVDDAPTAAATWVTALQLNDWSGWAGWDAMRDAGMATIKLTGLGAFASGTFKQSTSN